MSVVARLRSLVDIIRSLLGCSMVYYVLHCPDGRLGHPLLHFLSDDHEAFGDELTLFAHEALRRLCEKAIESQQVWCLNQTQLMVPGGPEGVMRSVAIAPLLRPAGLLGVVICFDQDPEAFLAGECLLIERHVPDVARRVERVLSDEFLPHSLHTNAGIETDVAMLTDPQAMTGMRGPMLLLSLIGHELRSPLAAIKGYAGLLQLYGFAEYEEHEPAREVELQKHAVDVIIEQTRQLEMLIGDLMDLSRIEMGRLVVRPVAMDLALVCRKVAQLMQRVTQQHSIHCMIEDTLPLVRADPVRVQQVLTNLLENAMKYSPDGGEIEIIVGAETMQPYSVSYVMVTVRDHGIGIPHQQQAKLFQLFSRLEHAPDLDVPGYGLGLYIAHRLVEAMGGRVTLTSREHVGTSVSFTLPTL